MTVRVIVGEAVAVPLPEGTGVLDTLGVLDVMGVRDGFGVKVGVTIVLRWSSAVFRISGVIALVGMASNNFQSLYASPKLVRPSLLSARQ